MDSAQESTSAESTERLSRRLLTGPYGPYCDRILRDGVTPELIQDMKAEIPKCPVGDGNGFRDLVAVLFLIFLRGVVDEELARTEMPAKGGSADIELPMRLEVLREHPLWEMWTRRYGIRSIVVEAKNTRDKVSVSAVAQIQNYLDTAQRGKFGFLVSRSGFEPGAYENLVHIAEKNECLIIPLEADDLFRLLDASADGCAAISEYLRRQETLLLRQLELKRRQAGGQRLRPR